MYPLVMTNSLLLKMAHSLVICYSLLLNMAHRNS